MTSKPMRIGIIGAGANTAARHIPGLRTLPGVEIAAVVNRSRESSERAAARFGIPRAYGHWREAAADPEIDAILIGTWPNLHCDATIAALEAGKHVLCEARMARGAREAHAMASAARERPHLIAQLVPAPMTLRVDATIQKLMAEGAIGRPLAVEVRAGGAFLDREAPLHWRQDFELSGYNMLALGIWYEAVMRWIGQATRLIAMGRVFVPMRRGVGGPMRAVRVPEHLDVTAEMACGAQAHFQMSAATGLAGPPEAWVFGEEATLKVAGERLFIGRREEKALNEVAIAPELEGHWRVEHSFIGAIRGTEPVRLTTFEDGVKYMEFTEAAARAMAGGCAVTLPLDLDGNADAPSGGRTTSMPRSTA
jgi:predicted dehydrogenase